MTPGGYFVLVDVSNSNTYAIVDTRLLAGHIHFIVGVSGEGVNRNLYALPFSGKSKEMLVQEMRSVTGINSVSIVSVGSPTVPEELSAVRELLAEFGLDASAVGDQQLSMFVASKLAGEYTYFIDHEHSPTREKLRRMWIRRVDDLPKTTPNQDIEQETTQTESVETYRGVEIRTVTMTVTVSVEPPSPPPLP